MNDDEARDEQARDEQPRDEQAREDARARAASRRQRRRQSHPPSHLPAGWRISFIVAGWVLVLLGVAGLALPGIQGVVTILAGAALLSAASETAYWLLRSAFRRWPWGWRKLERTRRRLYRWIVRPRLGHRDGRDDEAPPRDDRQPPD